MRDLQCRTRAAAIVVLLAALGVARQPCAFAERLPLRTLTTGDGLANNVVNRIVSDSRGYVWFCTREGLALYDGHRFTTFGLAAGLPSAVINGLLESQTGDYWIATDDGLVRFAPDGDVQDGPPARRAFVRYIPGADRRARSIGAVLERRGGGLWVGTGLGLYRLEATENDWRFVAESIIDHTPEISALAEDASGALWIGASDGLYRWRAGMPTRHWTSADGLPGNRVLSVFVDRRHRVWVGTTQGLVNLRLDPQDGSPSVEQASTPPDVFDGRWVWQVTESWDGTIWVATDGGVARLGPATEAGRGPFRMFGASSGLPSPHVSALAEDRNGHLWIGTRHGAARLLASGFTIFDEHDGVPTAATLALTSRGDVLVMEAVDQWRVNRYDGRAFVESAIPQGRPSGRAGPPRRRCRDRRPCRQSVRRSWQ